ncbi:MAG: TerB family tellurite resistance protein [Pseudomonadota bacterium]
MKKVWKEIKNAFKTEVADEDEEVAHVAAAALMIEMCEADLETTPEELEAVARVLGEVFKLDQAVVADLVAQARRNNDQEISYFPHVEIVNRVCGAAEKAEIVRSLWEVAAADGKVDRYEEHYLRRLCELIHVPHRVFVKTRNEILRL